MTRCVCDDASFAARPAANERSGTGWQRVEPPQIIPKYTALLNSENYVTKRQSLKVPMHSGRRSTHAPGLTIRDAIAGLPWWGVQLLGELLLDRTNFNVMTVYISNPDNLKLMMNLLRDSSRNIQFEAFHVFKVGMRSDKGRGAGRGVEQSADEGGAGRGADEGGAKRG